jgi:hypothetical protein
VSEQVKIKSKVAAAVVSLATDTKKIDTMRYIDVVNYLESEVGPHAVIAFLREFEKERYFRTGASTFNAIAEQYDNYSIHLLPGGFDALVKLSTLESGNS